MQVVSLQIINMMTQEMYQGDRGQKKMSIFDEVAFMFGSSQRLARVVEDGYRRARKYNGSFGTIFQSILDTRLFGRVGDVMNNNAAWKFYLESKGCCNRMTVRTDHESSNTTSTRSFHKNFTWMIRGKMRLHIG
jgi:type IV secretory pathway VirB4 component